MGGEEPRATFKALITIEDVLNSRMIAYPFRLRCCLVTDGGGLDLVTAERARDFPQSPYIAEHNTAPIGKLPLNTNGGGLSTCIPACTHCRRAPARCVGQSEGWFSSGRQRSPLRDECIESNALIVEDAGAPDYMRRL